MSPARRLMLAKLLGHRIHASRHNGLRDPLRPDRPANRPRRPIPPAQRARTRQPRALYAIQISPPLCRRPRFAASAATTRWVEAKASSGSASGLKVATSSASSPGPARRPTTCGPIDDEDIGAFGRPLPRHTLRPVRSPEVSARFLPAPRARRRGPGLRRASTKPAGIGHLPCSGSLRRRTSSSRPACSPPPPPPLWDQRNAPGRSCGHTGRTRAVGRPLFQARDRSAGRNWQRHGRYYTPPR